MRWIKYCAWVFAGIYIVLGVAVVVRNPYIGVDRMISANTANAVVYIATGIILMLSPKLHRSYRVLLERCGEFYVFLAMIGFILFPNGGMLFGLMLTDFPTHWLHLSLGASNFFLAWASYEILLRHKHHPHKHDPVLHL